MKSRSLLSLVALALLAGTAHAASKVVLTPLEIADPDLPGGTYDLKMEMQKKVKEVGELVMQPDQVDTIKGIFLEQQRERATPYNFTAVPVTRSINVKFGSGLTPPVIRLSSNMLSTMVFTDSTGSPWPIESIALNRTLFSDGSQISSGGFSGEGGSKPKNILTIEPLSPVAYGNIAVTLHGLDAPVIFMLSSGQKEVDVRVDARIPGISPFKKKEACTVNCSSISRDLDDSALLFVDGTPPKDAAPLVASSDEIEAWEYAEALVVRTTSRIIYPSYSTSVTSSSGVTVYRFDKDVKNITISKGSSAKTIHIDRE